MLGKRLIQLRKKKKLTQEDVSKSLNISRSAYAGYEIGRRVPEYNTLENMANLFEVSIDYLVGRTNDQKTTDSEAHKLFIESLNLSDDEILKEFPIYYEGMELTKEEKMEFLAIARGILSAQKSLREKK